MADIGRLKAAALYALVNWIFNQNEDVYFSRAVPQQQSKANVFPLACSRKLFKSLEVLKLFCQPDCNSFTDIFLVQYKRASAGRLVILTDLHTPNCYRVIDTLSNMIKFAAEFQFLLAFRRTFELNAKYDKDKRVRNIRKIIPFFVLFMLSCYLLSSFPQFFGFSILKTKLIFYLSSYICFMLKILIFLQIFNH